MGGQEWGGGREPPLLLLLRPPPEAGPALRPPTSLHLVSCEPCLTDKPRAQGPSQLWTQSQVQSPW